MANADNRQQDPRERKGEKNETIDFSFALASLDDEKAAVCVFNEYTKKNVYKWIIQNDRMLYVIDT